MGSQSWPVVTVRASRVRINLRTHTGESCPICFYWRCSYRPRRERGAHGRGLLLAVPPGRRIRELEWAGKANQQAPAGVRARACRVGSCIMAASPCRAPTSDHHVRMPPPSPHTHHPVGWVSVRARGARRTPAHPIRRGDQLMVHDTCLAFAAASTSDSAGESHRRNATPPPHSPRHTQRGRPARITPSTRGAGSGTRVCGGGGGGGAGVPPQL